MSCASLVLALAVSLGYAVEGSAEPQGLPALPVGLGVRGALTGGPGCRTDWWPDQLRGRLWVTTVYEGSGADTAGVRPGDVVAEVVETPGGVRVVGTREGLRGLGRGGWEGQVVEVVIFRAVGFPPHPGPEPAAGAGALGLRVEAVPDGRRRARFFSGACLVQVFINKLTYVLLPCRLTSWYDLLQRGERSCRRIARTSLSSHQQKQYNSQPVRDSIRRRIIA